MLPGFLVTLLGIVIGDVIYRNGNHATGIVVGIVVGVIGLGITFKRSVNRNKKN